MKRIIEICLAAACLLSLFSCGNEESKVIPRDKLSAIYAEMFVTDQWINAHPESRRTADTSLVYDPIFEKYGYTADDYRRSMDYYLSDPDKYARILRESSVIIEDRIRELRKEKEMLDEITRLRRGENRYSPERIYYLTGLKNPDLSVLDSLSFFVDSTGGRFDFDPQAGYDTVFAGPVLLMPDDSLGMADTSAMSAVADSSAAKGSAVKDTAVRNNPDAGKTRRRPVPTRPGTEPVRINEDDMEISKASPAVPIRRQELNKKEN